MDRACFQLRGINNKEPYLKQPVWKPTSGRLRLRWEKKYLLQVITEKKRKYGSSTFQHVSKVYTLFLGTLLLLGI